MPTILFEILGNLIFNSLISIDYSENFLRNFGFLRIIILFVAFNTDISSQW